MFSRYNEKEKEIPILMDRWWPLQRSEQHERSRKVKHIVYWHIMQFGACPTSSVAVRNPGGKMSACFSLPGVCMAIFFAVSFCIMHDGLRERGSTCGQVWTLEKFLFLPLIYGKISNKSAKCKHHSLY